MSTIKPMSISRRGALQGLAVATAAGVAAPAMANISLSEAADGLRTFNGRYALPGGRIVAGYFVSPRSSNGMAPAFDTVVVVPGAQGVDADARALANGYARAGKMVIVPDMVATYAGLKSLAGRDAHIADLKALAPAFAKKAWANGNVEYVAVSA